MSLIRRGIVVIAAVLSAACAAHAQIPSDEEMLINASALTKVAAAVESAVKFRDAPASLTEAELLSFATAHDPEMLEPFRGYSVRPRRVGMDTSVLLCTADNKIGLLEDAGCSAESDAHLWKRSPSPSCDFHLNLTQVCSTR